MKRWFSSIKWQRDSEQDKVFGISGRAKAAIKEKGHENVANATIALLDDDGG